MYETFHACHSRPKMEDQVRCAIITSLEGVFFRDGFIVGRSAGSTEYQIMHHMTDKNVDTIKRIVKVMQDLAIKTLTLVAEEDVVPAAERCADFMQSRYNVVVMLASDLLTLFDFQFSSNFIGRAMALAKQMAATNDGEIDAKDFFTRMTKDQNNRAVTNSLLHAFVEVHCTVHDNNKIFKLK